MRARARRSRCARSSARHHPCRHHSHIRQGVPSRTSGFVSRNARGPDSFPGVVAHSSWNGGKARALTSVKGIHEMRQLFTRRTDMRIWLAGLTMWLAMVGTGLWLGGTSGPAAAPAPKVYVGLFKDDAVAVIDPAQ